MDIQLSSAILTAKVLRSLLRRVGSGATAAPGLVSQYIDEEALRKLGKYYSNIILVSGTNGKTTTARLISAILEKADIPHVDNREGSNLVRGITASLMAEANLAGASPTSTAVLEVDEAALPVVISQISPRVIVLNNLFRDQLDRYGEVDTIRKLWLNSVQNLDSSTTLILNSDDPAVGTIKETRAKISYFGIEDKDVALTEIPHAADFLNCTNCRSTLKYKNVFLSHLGHYYCPNCDLSRQKPEVGAIKVALDGLRGSEVQVNLHKTPTEITTRLPGLYNVYNILAAVTVAAQLGVDPKIIAAAIGEFKPAFGRTERIESQGKKIYISLVKNPTGFNEAIRTVFASEEKKTSLIAINDLIADGRDVSWLWDVDFERLVKNSKYTIVSGIRAPDMVLRLKYAEAKNFEAEKNVEIAFEQALKKTESGETLFIFPTYTAMLKLKSLFAKKGLSSEFWED